jgi:suppressor of G2 allele of SKP1
VKAGDREATSTLLLGGHINPSGCRWSATPRKIELVLQKASPGAKWGIWGKEEIGTVAAEGDGEASDLPVGSSVQSEPKSEAASAADTAPAALAASSTSAPSGPAYPTSSKTGPKDWEKLGEGEDDDDKQDVNFFFKQLYKGATPEQQRAMMKSFIESNGTSLSTDWDDVKGRKVETIPPEGVEAKKWDS